MDAGDRETDEPLMYFAATKDETNLFIMALSTLLVETEQHIRHAGDRDRNQEDRNTYSKILEVKFSTQKLFLDFYTLLGAPVDRIQELIESMEIVGQERAEAFAEIFQDSE